MTQKHRAQKEQMEKLKDLRYFVENTAVPGALQPFAGLATSQRIRELVLFRNFPALEAAAPADTLEGLAALLTESAYLAPMRDTLQTLAAARAPLHHFTFGQRAGRAGDGGPLNRTVGGGRAMLLYLLGPTQVSSV